MSQNRALPARGPTAILHQRLQTEPPPTPSTRTRRPSAHCVGRAAALLPAGMKSDAEGEQRAPCTAETMHWLQSSWRPFPVTRDGQAAAPVKRARAGAGTRPCGTPVSSSARCCSRSTAAAAGPPPICRTGFGTCACAIGALHKQRPPCAGHQPASGALRMQAAARAGRTPYTSSPRAAARDTAGAGPPG